MVGIGERSDLGEGARGTELRTFLIADVRGYTTYTREQGDEAAGELAARFAGAVRDVAELNEGFLLELRGDEALVVFVSARRALRAAVAMQARFREIGLARGVGIGLDAGEAVAVEGGYRGGALNLAARLCAQAKAGEVLASEAVIHLAAKVDGLAYLDPRNLKLKGYDHPVRAVDVVASDQVPGRLSRRMHRASSRLRVDRRLQAAIGVIVVIALLALLVPRLRGDDQTPEQAGYEPGLAFFDAATGTPIRQISMNQPALAFFDDGTFWVRDPDSSVYVAVDAATHEITARVPAPTGYADAEDGRLYVGDFNAPSITVIDVASERVLRRIDLRVEDGDTEGISGLLVSNGSIWVQHLDEVFRIDPLSGREQARIPGIGFGLMIEAEDGSIWTASDAGLVQIDPATNEPAATFERGTDFGSVASQGGAIWTADEAKGVVYKLDPDSGELIDTYEADEGSRYLAAGDGKVWVANQDVGTVTVIDAVTGERMTYPMGHLTAGVAVGGGQALVTILPWKTFEDEIDSLQGDVAKVLVPGYSYHPIDPAVAGYAWDPLQQQLADATCARLLRYPASIDPAGWRLEPEVATDLPTVSADGRTYTFRIGEGFAFSPPSNEPITAETYAYSIERALSPVFGDQSQAPWVIDDIVGQAAYRRGAAEHIAGIRTNGSTLSITLRQPSDSFLDRLAFPAFCPVPMDTPIVAGGVAESTSGFARPSLAMSGPFFVSIHLDGELMILERNPNYHGPREATLDAIALREGLDPSIGIGRVEDGSWDLSLNPDPSLEPGAIIDTAWGPESSAAAAGDQRYFPVGFQASTELALNAGRPLFADERIRRAVALALSRDDAAAAVGDAVAGDALVIAGLPGAPDGQIFDGAGDPDAATEAMSSARGGEAVFAYAPDCEECTPILSMIQERLAPLGIRVRGEVMDDPYGEYFSGHASFDMILTYTGVDFADGTTFLGNMIGGIPPDWLPPGVQRSVDALDRLNGDERDLATAALAEELTRSSVPAVALVRSTWPAYFSPRLGCRVFPPFGAGPDLASLCLADTG